MHNLLTTSTVPAAALPGVLGAIAVFRLEYCIHAKVSWLIYGLHCIQSTLISMAGK